MSGVGYISKIELENFMCHRKFEIDLSPNMNLIVGRNGSGKSSILTALIIGLGGGARTTGRGDNYKALIRHNCTDAYIKLTIRNFRGGIHLERFGPTFTIQRRIGLKTSSYSIKNQDGKTLSTKLQDVRNICIHFGYHPDNVLVMLNQESAKEFLVTATPQVKYARLAKALQVDEFLRTMLDVDRTIDHRYTIKESLQNQQATLEAREKSETVILDNAKEMHRAATRITNLEAVLQWRKVRKHEFNAEKVREQVEETQEQYEQVSQSHSSGDQGRILRDKILKLEAAAEPLQNEKTVEEQKLRELESRVNDYTRKVEAAQKTHQTATEEHRKAQNERDELLKDKMPAAAPASSRGLTMSQLIEDQKKYRERIAGLSLEHGDVLSEISQHDDVRSEKMQRNRGTTSEIASLESSLLHEETALRQATSGQRNPLSGFGSEANKIRQLDGMLEKAQWKTAKPVGPLGRNVRSTDNKWARLVENIIRNVAWTYWVQSREDQMLLQKLARQAGMEKRLTVLLWSPERFSYNKIRAQLGYTRFIDCVKFDDELIERIFVDQIALENDVFCDEVDTAVKVSSQERQARYVYAPNRNGDGWRRFSIAANGNRDNRPVHPSNNLVHLQPATDSPEAARQAIQDRIDEYRVMLQSLRARQAQETAELREINEVMSRLVSKKTNIEERKVDAETKLRKVQHGIDEIEKAYSESTEVDIETLAKNIDRTIRARQIEIDSTERLVQNAQKELILVKSSYETQNSVTNDFADKLIAAGVELEEATRELRTHERQQQQHIAQKSMLERRLETLQGEHNEHLELLEEATQAASEVGPRPVLEDYDNKDDTQISSDITRFQALRDQLQQSNIDLDKRHSELDQLRQEISMLKNHFKRHCDELECMIKSCKKRKLNATKQHEITVANISKAYKSFIAERNFTGKLTIDTKNKKLVAEANPQSTRGESRSTTTLSGGEKSFTQICLLLSIWSNISTGLVAMDEYDVFMDEVFRAASMEALVQTITGKGAQGILITPQGLPRTIVEKYKNTDVFMVHNLESPR